MNHPDVTLMSKLCDAADWFRPDILDIITTELREVPRFHRKQWESAMIILALRRAGKLHADSLGLSMGGGKERVLYAIAPHLHQLVVTDLYEAQTAWDCARTDDPESFVADNMPFPVDRGKIRAMRMDMRALGFADRTFDLCYSTCAVEHIGRREDFLRHFNEVARVLKDDGIYVFTTEVLYGERSIPDLHNHVFSLRELHGIIAESGLVAEEEFDARLTQHKINYPAPSNLKSLSCFTPELFTERFLQESPHLQLMRGKHPFTCGMFVLRKRPGTMRVRETSFIGLERSRAFVESGVAEYRSLLEHSSVSINPFSLLPAETSRFFADHAEFFTPEDAARLDPETAFHSDYFWFGGGRRVFDVTLERVTRGDGAEGDIELRIHRFKTLASEEVDCPMTMMVKCEESAARVFRMEVETDEEYCYAILAKVRGPGCLLTGLGIRSYPAQLAPNLVGMVGVPDGAMAERIEV